MGSQPEIFNTVDDTIIITYYVGFSCHDQKVEIESEKYFGDKNHIKAYVDRYVTSHYLKKPERFEWHMKKLLHKIMMSALPKYDPEMGSRSFYEDFSEPEKAAVIRDFMDDF